MVGPSAGPFLKDRRTGFRVLKRGPVDAILRERGIIEGHQVRVHMTAGFFHAGFDHAVEQITQEGWFVAAPLKNGLGTRDLRLKRHRLSTKIASGSVLVMRTSCLRWNVKELLQLPVRRLTEPLPQHGLCRT